MRESRWSSIMLLLTRSAGTTRAGFHEHYRLATEGRWSDLAGVVAAERYDTVENANAERGDLPTFGPRTYDGLQLVRFDSRAAAHDALTSGAFDARLAAVRGLIDVAASAVALVDELVVADPGDAPMATLGCLRRRRHLSPEEFDASWSSHVSQTEALLAAGVMRGYAQARIDRTFPVGGLPLPWVTWDGITRGFWDDREALQRRREMTAWQQDCSADEELFIDHARSLIQLCERHLDPVPV